MLELRVENRATAEAERRRAATSSVNEPPPQYDNDKYHAHLLDQYKLYVEMADRLSARKVLVNNTFTTLLGAAAVGFASAPKYFENEYAVFFQLGIMSVSLTISIIWWGYVVNHAKLSDTKYRVIHEIEELLPAQPYKMEYEYCIKERKTSSGLRRIDRILPVIAGILSIAGLVFATVDNWSMIKSGFIGIRNLIG